MVEPFSWERHTGRFILLRKRKWNDNSHIGSYHTAGGNLSAPCGLCFPCEEAPKQGVNVSASGKSGRVDYQWELYAFTADEDL